MNGPVLRHRPFCFTQFRVVDWLVAFGLLWLLGSLLGFFCFRNSSDSPRGWFQRGSDAHLALALARGEKLIVL